MNTTQIILTVVIAVAAYFIGGLSPALLISRTVTGKDIRETGSGNAGATNVMRSIGVRYGLLTFLLDVLKGVIPTLIAKLCIDQFAHYSTPNASYAAYLAGFMVILGHTFPLLLGFRGGKGVATSAGMFFVLQPLVTAVLLLLALGLMFATAYVSLGSVVSFALMPFSGFLIPAVGWPFGVFSLFVATLVLWKHRENIERLIKGTENRIDPKKLKK
jgi:acyl phosphate:glycerol-3-phosphate acyltransferase